MSISNIVIKPSETTGTDDETEGTNHTGNYFVLMNGMKHRKKAQELFRNRKKIHLSGLDRFNLF